MNADIRAPAGWGFVPGARLTVHQRATRVPIAADILAIPDLPKGIRAKDLITRYGCHRATAYRIARTLRRDALAEVARG